MKIKISKSWQIALISLVGVLIIAAALRLFNLTILPVFVDEAIYIRWSQIMSNEPTLRFLPLSDGKQPLFMWILMFLVRKLSSDPLFAGRVVSAAAGIGTIINIASTSYLLFRSRLVALASALIWAISPFSLFFDRMALVDSLLTFLGSTTFLLGLLTAKFMRPDLAMLTGFALGGALLTKSPGIFFALLLPTTWIFSVFPKNLPAGRQGKHLPLHLLKLVTLLLLTFIIAFVLYNILRLGPNFHLITSRNQDYVYGLDQIIKSPFDPFKSHFMAAINWLVIWGPIAILPLIILGAISKIKDWKKILILLAWGLLPIIINCVYAKVLTARYILFCLPPLFIIAGYSLGSKNKILKSISLLIFSIFIIHSILIDITLLTNPPAAPMPRSERSGYLEEWTSGTGIKEVAMFLKEEHNKNPEIQIVVGTEGYFGTLPDGLQLYLDGVPNTIVIGVGLNIGDVHQSLKESKKAGNKTYLVANSSRLNFKTDVFEDYGLKVVKEFKKANRANATREIVQFGPYDTFYLFEVQ